MVCNYVTAVVRRSTPYFINMAWHAHLQSISLMVRQYYIKLNSCDLLALETSLSVRSKWKRVHHRHTVANVHNFVTIILSAPEKLGYRRSRCRDSKPLVKRNRLWSHCIITANPCALTAYMRQRIWSALVQIIACRLFGAKPLSKPMLGYCQLDPQGQT